MTKSMRALLMGAALTGLTAGTNLAAMAQSSGDQNKPQTADSGKKADKKAKTDKNSCKGQNSSKGKGDDKNSCKGKSGCGTDGKKPGEQK